MSNSPDTPHANYDAASFLMGGSVPSASFLKHGDSVTGTVSEPPTVQQQRDMQTNALKTWDDGSPMLQLVVTLQTDERDAGIEDDDGRRRCYLKFNMKKSVADAVRKAGCKALELGGRLTITYTHDGEPTKRGFNPPKFYEAEYIPPAANFLNDNDEEKHGGNKLATVTVKKVRCVQSGAGVVYLLDTTEGEFGTRDVHIGSRAMKVEGKRITIEWQANAKGGRSIVQWSEAAASPPPATTSDDGIDVGDIPF